MLFCLLHLFLLVWVFCVVEDDFMSITGFIVTIFVCLVTLNLYTVYVSKVQNLYIDGISYR